MSHTNRNFLIAYILLVGIPLVALVGILRAGRSLPAPISIDGVWKLEAVSQGPPAQPCGKFAADLSNSSLSISQSGKSLALAFGNALKSSSSGWLEGTSLNASVSPADTASACDGEVMITSVVDPKTEPRSLEGSITIKDCASCRPILFHAVRQARHSTGGTR